MAKYYDIFYSNKSYNKEVKFLIDLISSKIGIMMRLLLESIQKLII